MTWPMKEATKKRMELIGIECRVRELPEDISQREFEKEFQKINQDPSVHGILCSIRFRIIWMRSR